MAKKKTTVPPEEEQVPGIDGAMSASPKDESGSEGLLPAGEPLEYELVRPAEGIPRPRTYPAKIPPRLTMRPAFARGCERSPRRERNLWVIRCRDWRGNCFRRGRG